MWPPLFFFLKRMKRKMKRNLFETVLQFKCIANAHHKCWLMLMLRADKVKHLLTCILSDIHKCLINSSVVLAGWNGSCSDYYSAWAPACSKSSLRSCPNSSALQWTEASLWHSHNSSACQAGISHTHTRPTVAVGGGIKCKCKNLVILYMHFMQSTYRLYISLYGQTVRWCDEGAYLMANQLLDKFQSKEGAQVALRDIEKLMETASVLRSNPGFLSLEFEAILTPQLQVLTHIEHKYTLWNQ